MTLDAEAAESSADAGHGPTAPALRPGRRSGEAAHRSKDKGSTHRGSSRIPAGSSFMDIRELQFLAASRQRLFRSFIQMKSAHDIELSDVFIFLGLGLLNYERSNVGPVHVQPIGISSVSDFLAMPKETVRRRLALLEKRGLVTKTGYGFVVKDAETWKGLAHGLSA